DAARPEAQLVVEDGWGVVPHVRFDHGAGHLRIFERAVVDAGRAQILHAGYLEVGQKVAVVDHAHRVGLGVANAQLVAVGEGGADLVHTWLAHTWLAQIAPSWRSRRSSSASTPSSRSTSS